MEIKFKKLTKSRGLTIPRDMAAHLDLDAGTAVDLTASADGKGIQRHGFSCRHDSGGTLLRRRGKG